MKQAVFLIVNNGRHGNEPTYVNHAFTDEQERDKFFECMMAGTTKKHYHHTEDRVVDLEVIRKEVLANLDGLAKLALGIIDHPKS